MNNETKKGKLVPELRFPGFDGEWEVKILGEIADRCNFRNKDKAETRVLTNSATEGVVDQNAYFDKDIAVKENTDNYHIVDRDDFVYNPRISTSAPVGPISRNKLGRGIMSPLYSVFRFKSENIDYLEHFFSTTLWHKYLKQVANYGARFDRMAISTEDFYAMPIFVPSLPEQQKIAECLSSVDDLIQAEADQLQALKDHKKGLMQQLFPQDRETTPKLRFPGFEGEWEEKKLGEIADKCTSRNRDKSETRVLTNSATEGVVDQNAYFDRDIAVKENTDNYHIVDLDDFVYNPRISTSAPVCPISRNKIGRGIMSPRYSVFRFKSENIDYLEHFFSTTIWHRYLKSVANYGARFDRMAISTEDFYSMPILCPDPSEQQKIAECLSSLDEGIAAQQEKVEALKEHKKGLMQKLFPNLQ